MPEVLSVAGDLVGGARRGRCNRYRVRKYLLRLSTYVDIIPGELNGMSEYGWVLAINCPPARYR